jgi:ABC-type transporter MlaC component
MVTPDNTDSREAALELVRNLADRRFRELKDEDTRIVLSPDVVDAVFDAAWEHQFDRDRTSIQRKIRDIVQTAVSKVVDNDAD